MVHPCRSGEDTGPNPVPAALVAAPAPGFKMHACVSKRAEKTLCGLGHVLDVDGLVNYTSVCRSCYPRLPQVAWTPDHGDPGDLIIPAPPPAGDLGEADPAE
jgi:hypothetical protein